MALFQCGLCRGRDWGGVGGPPLRRHPLFPAAHATGPLPWGLPGGEYLLPSLGLQVLGYQHHGRVPRPPLAPAAIQLALSHARHLRQQRRHRPPWLQRGRAPGAAAFAAPPRWARVSIVHCHSRPGGLLPGAAPEYAGF
ncbi:hypothetical protein NDU88_001077 [Pleurodeles waltl]|uniref:Uncharacterized protein n=1 Tax=Pleurodeles waltl TaxID=8319 RepID=A0AAV7MIQ9_PLEWA|nr:hypothetical protein NDU88_001077 [Pleurodeles waltl]